MSLRRGLTGGLAVALAAASLACHRFPPRGYYAFVILWEAGTEAVPAVTGDDIVFDVRDRELYLPPAAPRVDAATKAVICHAAVGPAGVTGLAVHAPRAFPFTLPGTAGLVLRGVGPSGLRYSLAGAKGRLTAGDESVHRAAAGALTIRYLGLWEKDRVTAAGEGR